ncbi:hypothetical protein SUDANB120_06329 (plasmid) [Streptomyces sp. enrichment culture]|uniref:hypothetical protein n=1 Tax=Streptomyces sp. enrichment culture TaxID=1795815 RepID=UPI003F57F8DA
MPSRAFFTRSAAHSAAKTIRIAGLSLLAALSLTWLGAGAALADAPAAEKQTQSGDGPPPVHDWG